jgi:signal transduction histidine kinase
MVGERAAVRETDEAIVTIEQDRTLARANDTARKLFGEQLDDKPFADLVGCELQELGNKESIECWTADGRKQFDPRVTVLTNAYDEVYGYTVTLIDITDREIRRQRIEVLNRILRHNIRNEVSVIEARAELAMDPDQPSEDHLELIKEVAGDLEGLSANARQIEKLMQGSQDRVQFLRIDDTTESVAEDVIDDGGVTVETDLPSVSIQVDPGLLRYALRQSIENAVEHNDTDKPRVRLSGGETPSGVEIVVSDNGPGIPKAERDVIAAGSETSHDHASSLGLWGTNWAVQQLGGDLAFRESDLGGTSVVIELPTS